MFFDCHVFDLLSVFDKLSIIQYSEKIYINIAYFLLLLLFGEKYDIIIKGDKMENKFTYHHIGKDEMYKIWHTVHNRMMIIYMYSDGRSIVFSDKIYPIKKGVLCFIGSNKYHYTMPDNPEIYDRSKMSLSSENLFKLLSILPEGNAFYKIFTADSAVYAQIPENERKNVENLIDEIKKYKNHKDYSEMVFLNCYMKLLIYLHKYASERIPAPSGFAAKAIEYINSRISEDITIDEISEAVHMSKYHLCRCFKNITGFTIMEYILKTRLAAAKIC